MDVMQAWEETLNLLAWQKLKPFLFGFLHSLEQTYRLFFKRFWGLFVACLVILWSVPVIEMLFNYLFPFNVFDTMVWVMNYKVYFGFSRIIVWNLLSFVIFLCAKLAIDGHGDWPWRSYLRHGLYTFLPLTIVMLILFGITVGMAITYPEMIPWIMMSRLLTFTSTFFILATSLVIFSLFFFLDSPASCINFGQACIRGVLMFWYNLPFCAAAFVAYYGINLLLQPIFVLLGFIWLLIAQTELMSLSMLEYFFSVIMLMLMPVFICLMGQWYKARIVDQRALYFK